MSAGSQRRSSLLRRQRELARQRKACHLYGQAQHTPALQRLERLLSTPALDWEQAQLQADAIRQLADEIDRDHGQTV